jgi:GT2 family glycosyltransferase
MKAEAREVQNVADASHLTAIPDGRGSDRPPPVRISHMTWLADGLLLLAGPPALAGGHWPTGTVTVRDKAVAAEVEAIPCNLPSGDTVGSRHGTLILVHCELSDCRTEAPQALVLGSGAAADEPVQLPVRLTDLPTLLRTTVTGSSAGTRARVMQHLVAAAADRLCGPRALATAGALFAVREALRERLLGPTIVEGSTLGGGVDGIFAVSANAFYVRGWLVCAESPATRVTAVSPEGCRTELLGRLYRHSRADLNDMYGAVCEDGGIREAGFLGYFETAIASHLNDGWLIEVATAFGDEIELAVPAVVRDPTAVRAALLADVACDPGCDSSLVRDHLAPAIRRIQEGCQNRLRVDKVAQYGAPPADPTVSVIIPLYGRIDFLEHQLAQFVHDPEINRADVIYVLDSPELTQGLLAAAPRLERLYRVPFRVATLRANVGFAGANNAGVSLARGRLLLLLNPDILPERPGWLGRMTAFHDATPGIGALGPKLLYEDDTIQHAGIFFYREPQLGLWSNEHYYKGLHRAVPSANVTRPVPAVSAACMMIDADLYREVGGLSGLYVQGDYEDTDLCLRLAAVGRQSWYLSDVELYHLEGQSYPAELRKLTRRFNQWLHSATHGDAIERLQAGFAARESGSNTGARGSVCQ